MTEQETAEEADAVSEHPRPARRRRSQSSPQVSKRSMLIRLLQAKGGAEIAVISARLGWLPHTTRAALSGLRKAGYVIEAEKGGKEKPTRYRIVGEASSTSSAEAR